MKNPKNRRPKKCVKLLFGKYLIFQMRCRFLRPCIPQTNKTNKRTHRLTFHVKGFSFWWTGYTESINVKWGVSTCPENSEIETLSKCRRHFHATLVVFLGQLLGNLQLHSSNSQKLLAATHSWVRCRRILPWSKIQTPEPTLSLIYGLW